MLLTNQNAEIVACILLSVEIVCNNIWVCRFVPVEFARQRKYNIK